MRIISGIHKGRKIFAPKQLPVRPTTDMAKEALFNILSSQYYIDELRILDLFCGIGSISFEFASREAAQVTAVDSHRGCLSFVRNTAEKLGMDITTIQSDAFRYLEAAAGKWDIIFADPPYDLDKEQFEKIADIVFKYNLLHENGVLIIEHSKRMSLSGLPGFSKVKSYGSSAFSFFSN